MILPPPKEGIIMILDTFHTFLFLGLLMGHLALAFLYFNLVKRLAIGYP